MRWRGTGRQGALAPARMRRPKANWNSRRRLIGRLRHLRAGDAGHLLRQFGEGRKAEVPLQAGGHRAGVAVGLGQQIPHRVDDRGAMGVDEQAVVLHMVAGHMDVAGACQRQRAEEIEGVEAEVAGIDQDVVHVQVEQAVGLVDNRADEAGLVHLGAGGVT
jgi:hypothetical protein